MVAVAEATPGAAETQAAVEEWVVMKERGMPGMRENLLEAKLLSACWGSCVYLCMHCARECACPLCVRSSMHTCIHTHACMHACIPNVI